MRQPPVFVDLGEFRVYHCRDLHVFVLAGRRMVCSRLYAPVACVDTKSVFKIVVRRTVSAR
jgi:hypothetical protein